MDKTHSSWKLPYFLTRLKKLIVLRHFLQISYQGINFLDIVRQLGLKPEKQPIITIPLSFYFECGF